MTTLSEPHFSDAASRLYQYLLNTHWNGRTLQGPDPGIRWNARIGRFFKSYASWYPWRDAYEYMQAQKYWILNNLLVADLGLDDAPAAEATARACAESLLRAQQPEGYWVFQNPEWKGRILTVEGNYAAIGLLQAFERTQDDRFLGAAKQWYQFVLQTVGFQQAGGYIAPNYFANRQGGMVPNITASLLHAVARLWKASGEDRFLEYRDRLVCWLNYVQLPSGELPYAVNIPGKPDRTHFLCYQYNAFEFLNLSDYYALTDDDEICPVLERIVPFIADGVTPSGAAKYSCAKATPTVTYYGAALAAALNRATQLEIGDYRELSDRAYRRVLQQQRPDGNLACYSSHNYRLFQDRRSYPRYLGMILYHLLLKIQSLRTHAECPETANI